MTNKEPEDSQLVETIIDTLDAKKAEELVVLNVKAKSSIADYYVICTGLVNRHVKHLSDEVKEVLKEQYNVVHYRIAGTENKEWIILDYGSILVHILLPELRKDIKLEDLWGKKNPSV